MDYAAAAPGTVMFVQRGGGGGVQVVSTTTGVSAVDTVVSRAARVESAAAPADYVAGGAFVTWLAGASRARTVTVPNMVNGQGVLPGLRGDAGDGGAGRRVEAGDDRGRRRGRRENNPSPEK